MTIPLLATKLFIPTPRPIAVHRSRLIERLNDGLHRKLTLVSAPAGFGKTTLVAEWLANCARPAAWLSLDEGDNDLQRFLTYFVAALQTIVANLGQRTLAMLQSPQLPPTESLLTTLLNNIASVPEHFTLVIDDYHVIDAKSLDYAITFLLERLPPQMHMVIATREDPHLPLARLRVRDQLTELRVADLRFTPAEAAAFLTQVMGLVLSSDDIAALETRTEGWIAGLQLAAISLQAHPDTSSFITSFTGGHHFVMDYLVEEVLRQQPEEVQMFLLRTSILDRLCGSLCDAVVLDADVAGQDTLELLEHANLFITPLDDERRWYRYHHLFADLLRQRLHQQAALSDDKQSGIAELHGHASVWYEEHGMELEAFQHAVAAHDVDRAAHLIGGSGIPWHSRGAVTAILSWLDSLPATVLDARPWLWWRHASLLLINGQTSGVEEKLDAADAALFNRLGVENEVDDEARNLIGQIAAARATLALTRYRSETMLVQSRRALDYLAPENRSARASAMWTLGVAYNLKGDRAAARHAYTEALALSQMSENSFNILLATLGLANIQEADNQLHQAAETYQRILNMAGATPLPIASEAHLPLARICYEWNDLEAAEFHARQSLELAGQFEQGIDRFVLCEVFLARLKLAQGDVDGAAILLAQASQSARQQDFVDRLPEIAAVQILAYLRQGKLAAAAHLAVKYDLPLSQARVHLAQGDPSAAQGRLEPWLRQVEAKGWADERLRGMALQSIALDAHGDKEWAAHTLSDALTLAETGGFIRLFVDEGPSMARLLSAVATQGIMPDYSRTLLSAFGVEKQRREGTSRHQSAASSHLLAEPLSQRELEVLYLIAQGCSNAEISARLFIALDTVKGHNRKIFSKLQVQRRTEAVARARELGLL
jgi:LuxR family maltose regulon positive regulatory protein